MKKYWLFACCEYEASGGLRDLVAIGDDVEVLKKSVKCKYKDNAWIVDTETWTTILIGDLDQSTRNAYGWREVNEPIGILQKENK